jgi:hypothetical protein
MGMTGAPPHFHVDLFHGDVMQNISKYHELFRLFMGYFMVHVR